MWLQDPQRLLRQLDLKADWIGLREIEEKKTNRASRNETPLRNNHSRTHGFMVEVIVDGQMGYAASPLLTEASVRACAERAVQQAKAAAAWSLHPVSAEAVRPMAQGEYRSPVQTSFSTWDARDWHDFLASLCRALKVSDKVAQAEAEVSIVERRSRFVSTSGSQFEQMQTMVTSHFHAIASDKGEVQRRSDRGGFARCHQSGLELFLTNDWLQRAALVGEQAIELLTADECPTGAMDLVLSPDQMLLQIHESIGHPLELDRVLGDERNYAGSSFVKPEDFGTLQYGSPLLNVTFDPTVEGEYASYRFDATGEAAEREYIIREGVLVRGLGGAESQLRSGLPGVACARTPSWNRPVIDRMANLNVEPGDSSREELFNMVENGVYMESNRSWSIDDYRRKFQFGCEYGKLIENGKLTKTVRNPNYRGVSNPFWRSLKAVGDADTFEVFGSPFCGKGEPNQLIRVGHASPLCLFENVEVFGGAQ
jgi:predicted Zn-dependent protease